MPHGKVSVGAEPLEQVYQQIMIADGPRKSPGDVKDGIRTYIRKRHARQ